MGLIIFIRNVLNLTAIVDVKTLKFSWDVVQNASSPVFYKLLSKPDSNSQFTEIPFGGHITDNNFSLDIALHRIDWSNVRFRLEAYSQTQNEMLFAKSEAFVLPDPRFLAVGYVKSPDTADYDRFGYSVAVSGDGSTLVVGSLTNAVYIYSRAVNNSGKPIGSWTYTTTIASPYLRLNDAWRDTFFLGGASV